MTHEDSEPLPVIDSWDTYWQGAQSSAAYSGGGSSHPLVLSFWNDYFGELQGRGGNPKIIDIASGNGAVVERASVIFDAELPEFTCLDVSASAIRMLEKRFPGVRGIVADAATIPLESASFDIATSQFGVEYAGLDALQEITRLIKAGGEIALLLHHRGGIIFQECSASLDAIRELQAAKFFPKCTAMFEAGFAVLKGGDPAVYSAAGKQFAPTLRAMEAIMMRHGRDVASGTIVRVYRDVRTMHSRMRYYEPSEVVAWLQNMEQALEPYAGRMMSMCDVAIDATGFEQVCASLTERGLDILRAEPLQSPQQDLPLAWALVAKKP